MRLLSGPLDKLQRLTTLALALTAALATHGALADTALNRLIPPDRLSCFGRNYDPAHLKRNPKQRITSFRLDFYPAHAEARGSPTERYEFHLFMRARNPDASVRSLGACFTDAGVFECKLECDVGRFGIKAVPPDGLQIMNKGIAFSCGEASIPDVKGAADKDLRLRRLPAGECRSPEQWDAVPD